MTTYETLVPLSDLLNRGEHVQAGELIGFDSVDGAQWCYFSHIEEGIAMMKRSPDEDSEDDPAMLVEQCFIQRPAVLVTDVVAMLHGNIAQLTLKR
ncbi:hypothetical protein [Spirosoma aerophilum]